MKKEKKKGEFEDHGADEGGYVAGGEDDGGRVVDGGGRIVDGGDYSE